MELYAVASDGRVFGFWCEACDGANWHPGPMPGAKFEPGTQLSAVSRDNVHEDVFGVDAAGRVWRAWWSTWTWEHPGYSYFGVFSPQGMLPQPGCARVQSSAGSRGRYPVILRV